MAMLFAVLVLGILGSKIPSDAEIAARIEEAIRAQLHPASVRVTVRRTSALSTNFESVEIAISGFDAANLPLAAMAPAPPAASGAAPRRARAIRVSEGRLICEHFTISGLRVRTLEWGGRNVQLPWQSVQAGAFEIAAAQAVSGYIVLEEQALTDFLRTRTLPLKGPRLAITPEECRVSGTTRTWIGLPIQLTGTLAARNGAVLYLDDPRLKVSVVPVPGAIADRVLRDINPLADLNKEFRLPAPLVVTRTVQQDGSLRFDGTLLFPQPENP